MSREPLDVASTIDASEPYAIGVNEKYKMTTIVGIKTNEGVVLGSDRRASKGFFIGSKITQKIAKIDDKLAVAIVDRRSDAEYMIKVAKAERRLME